MSKDAPGKLVPEMYRSTEAQEGFNSSLVRFAAYIRAL
jgi:hypothetical protein